MIQITNLKKSYKSVVALEIETLTIKRGETFGLVGNNGAGKTTLFSLLLDLRLADRGEVLSDGQNVKQSDHWKAYTGSYLDESFLIPYLSPIEFLKFTGNLYGLNNSDVQEFTEKYREFLSAELLGKNKLIRELSQGNKKKIGIAAALLPSPKVLILDEPFSNLDPTSQIQLKTILSNLHAAQNTTMLISSHDLLHVTEVCDRVAVLNNGILAYDMQTNENTLSELEKYFAAMAL